MIFQNSTTSFGVWALGPVPILPGSSTGGDGTFLGVTSFLTSVWGSCGSSSGGGPSLLKGVSSLSTGVWGTGGGGGGRGKGRVG